MAAWSINAARSMLLTVAVVRGRVILRSAAPCRGASRSAVVDRNICDFVWYGGVAGDGLRSVGEDFLPSSKSVCSILPIAHHSRAGVSRTWTSHPARRELRLYGVLGSPHSLGPTPMSAPGSDRLPSSIIQTSLTSS